MAPARPSTHSVFITVPNAGQSIGSVRTALHGLHEHVHAGRVVGVDLHYRNETDTALLGVRFDARVVTPPVLDKLRQLCAIAHATVVDCARMSEDERRKFQATYLPRYHVHVADLPGTDDALFVLAHLLGKLRRPTEANPPAAVKARFRHATRWQTARARGLTADGVYLATPVPPPRGVEVLIELSADGAAASARAEVLHVTPVEAASYLGSLGFGARFLLARAAERLALEALLDAARHTELVSPAPCARRRDPRYAVEFAIGVEVKNDAMRLRAIDVSRHGLFLCAEHAVLTEQTEAMVSLPIGDGPPVCARARVVRQVSPTVAEARGIYPGMGIEITSFAAGGDDRFARFIAQVGQRAERTVLVGALPERLEPMCAALLAVGYRALGAGDTSELLGKALALSPPPDLVIIESEIGPASARTVADTLSAHGIPVAILPGRSPQSWRNEADSRFGIATAS